MSKMIEHFAIYWDEWAMSAACLVVAACCFLRINSIPRSGSSVEKLLMYFMGLGAFGLMISPFCGYFSNPNVFELLFFAGVSVVALRMTLEEWRELGSEFSPRPKPAISKGVSAEEESCFP